VSLEHDPIRHRREPLRRIAYTVGEWSQITGLSRPTIYRMMARGELRFVQFGRTRRIPAEEKVRLGLTSEI
jgi:excisionase family DNA binding protein